MSAPASAPDFFERIRLVARPQANPAALLVSGQARFTVLTERLLRLEWSENSQFEDRATFAFPTRYSDNPPAFTRREEDGWLILDTGALVLRYKTGSTETFSPENLSIRLSVNGQPVEWQPGLVDLDNLRGTRRTLDECVGDVALETGLLSRSGWALFDDSHNFLFDENGWVAPRVEHGQLNSQPNGQQDWYFFGYGHDYKAALQEYTQFGGQIPLIPRFVLGAWWSRYWAYSDKDLMQLVDDFASHDLPLDVLVLDMDWHTTDSWTGYTWNRELFPDPPGFLKWVHDRGLRTTLNLHPAEGVQAFEEVYPQFAERLGLDPAQRQTIPFRVTDKAYVQHYFELLHHPLEDIGVDFWWMDWQQGRTSEIAGLDPLPWLNHLHFQDSTRRSLRAMLYSRWGGLGNHRYHIGFSGDTHAVWEALQFQPYFTATASNVCYGWWSHDIGGHVGATEPELFARWVQFGALNPCLRLHSTKQPEAERRPWAFSKEVFRASRTAFQLRYQLVPYLYTMGRVAMDTSLSLCRPMYYEHPEEEAAYVARYQYYLGDQLIAAPIVFPADPVTGLASTDVWLPEGEWFDYFTKESYQGPGWFKVVGDLERIPLFVRAGGIIPLSPLASTTDALPADRLIIQLFPGEQGEFRLYEDDGQTEAYHQGEYEWTPLKSFRDESTASRSWTLEIWPVEGNCPALPRERSYEVRFEGTLAAQAVLINGQATQEWRYDVDTATTVVYVPAIAKNQPVEIRLEEVFTLALNEAGPDFNQQAAHADLKRLLGAHCPSVKWEDMTEAVLNLDAPGKIEAIARLGGPLVRFIEYGTPEEAERQLGTVIVVGPQDGSEAEVTLTWRLFRPATSRSGNAEKVVQATVGREGQVFYAPFNVTRPDQPQVWNAEVAVNWQGHTLHFSHQSNPVCATIPRWEVAVFNEKEQPLKVEQVLDGNGQLNPQLEWEVYEPDLAELKSVNDPFYVRLRERYTPRIKAGEQLASYAIATIVSPDERDAIIQYRSGGPTELYLNGQPVKVSLANQETRPYILFHQTLRPNESQVVRLQAGVNRLVVATRPPAPIPFWWFSVAVVRPDGQILTDLRFE